MIPHEESKFKIWLEEILLDVKELVEAPERAFRLLEESHQTVRGILAISAALLPPVFLAILAANAIADLVVAVFFDKESSKFKRGTIVGLSFAALALFTLVLTLPFIALPLLIAAAGVRLVREAFEFFHDRKELKADRRKLALLQYEKQELEAKADPTPEDYDRLAQINEAIPKLQKRISKFETKVAEKRALIGFAAMALVGFTLLLFPPTLLIGVGLLATAIIGNLAVKAGGLIKGYRKAKQQRRLATAEQSDTVDETPEQVVTKQPLHKRQHSSTAEFATLTEEQKSRSDAEVLKHAIKDLKAPLSTSSKTVDSGPSPQPQKTTSQPQPTVEKKEKEDEGEGEGASEGDSGTEQESESPKPGN